MRAEDNQLVGDQLSGDVRFDGLATDFLRTLNCNDCHTLDPANGFFGTDGRASFENESQIIKIPHLRNLYQKVGMFGLADIPFVNTGDNGDKGDQVRGFGFIHDGSIDTLFRFFSSVAFNITTADKQQLEQFMLAFDTDLAPIVGQQVTLDASNGATVDARIDLLMERAEIDFDSEVLGGTVKECELVVRGKIAGVERGWLYQPDGNPVTQDDFKPDEASAADLSNAALRNLANVASQELTFTCAPPGSGVRMALDRDEDGVFDADERAAGTEPNNPGSLVGACADGMDNDGDGAIDLNDAGCADVLWDNERPQCSDGVNNDRDGRADFDGAGIGLPDAGCTGPSDKTETPTGMMSSCGLGLEVAVLLGTLLVVRRRRGEGAARIPRS